MFHAIVRSFLRCDEGGLEWRGGRDSDERTMCFTARMEVFHAE